jgi:2-dehydro-3-deoxyglucarate aldolase
MEQQNAVKAGLEAGDALFGAGVETGAPSLIEVYGSAGLSWVWIDLEHKNASPLDSNYLEGLVRAAECANTELIVRIAGSDPSCVRKVLDAGVRNVVVPRVETAAEVRRAVEASQYEYDGGPGERGVSFGRASNYGQSLSMDGGSDFHEREDDSVLVGVLIENETAVGNIDDIVQVPELGFVFPGPGDMGVSMEHTLEYGHPDVSAALNTVERACLDHDVPLLGLLGSNFDTLDDARRAVDNGYQLIGIGNEFSILRNSLEETLSALT